MTKQLLISDIQTESGTQTRVMIHEDTVAEYAEAMENGAVFPPIVVFHDGTDYYMADGFHRIMAASRNGFKDISADVRKGTKQDALIYALGANVANGLRRTNPDKRRCVEIALREFPDWSDRKIAEVCGVSDHTVGNVRKEKNDSCENFAPDRTTRTGRDGKQYPASKPKPDGWIAPEVSVNRKADPVQTAPQAPIQQNDTRPCVGMMHAENAIYQLEKISTRDREFTTALEFVARWIVDKLEEQK